MQGMAGASRAKQREEEGDNRDRRPHGTTVGEHESVGYPTGKRKCSSTNPAIKYPVIRPGTRLSQDALVRRRSKKGRLGPATDFAARCTGKGRAKGEGTRSGRTGEGKRHSREGERKGGWNVTSFRRQCRAGLWVLESRDGGKNIPLFQARDSTQHLIN